MDHFEQQVANFKAVLEDFGSVYCTVQFRYVAYKASDRFVLLKGIVTLMTAQSSIPPPPPYESDTLRIGLCSVFDVYGSVAELIDDLLSGKVKLPFGEAAFPTSNGQRPWAHFYPIQPPGVQGNQRQTALQLVGDQAGAYMPQADYDWVLRASHEPFESFGEILYHHGLGTIVGAVTVDFYAAPLATVDFYAKDTDGRAVPTVVIASGLDRDKASLGYKLLRNNVIIDRKRLMGSELTWASHGGFDYGQFPLSRTPDTYVYCVASYDGVAQQYGWLTDAAGSHNPRRRAFEAVDENLDIVRSIIGNTARKGVQARDLEAAAGVIFWMLGFSVVHLGSVPKLQDAADLIVTSPSGQMIVVECTISLLHSDKVSQLHDRTREIRRSVDLSGHQSLKILSALVTCEPAEDVAIQRQDIEKHGILVMAREELFHWLDMAHSTQDAETLFTQFMQRVEAARQNGQAGPHGISLQDVSGLMQS